MKKSLKFALSLAVILFISSCNTTDKKKKADTNVEKVVQKEQTYTMDTNGTSIQWLAYKFTTKLGVGGTFDQTTLNLENQTGSIERLLKGATMTIPIVSINSANEIRDPKLRTYFFKVFNTDTISGEILDAEGGIGALELNMNNLANDVEYTYSLKNDTLFLAAHLDLMQWDGEAALNSLNKECYELHTGPDGVSKLWPDVDVAIKFPLQEVSPSLQ